MIEIKKEDGAAASAALALRGLAVAFFFSLLALGPEALRYLAQSGLLGGGA